MNVPLIYKITGYLSILVGIAATLCITKAQLLFVGVMLSFAGFIFSIVNVFLFTKYYNEQIKYPKGYLGMFLSSLPILFMMFVIFKGR